MVEETGVPGENHLPDGNGWQIFPILENIHYILYICHLNLLFLDKGSNEYSSGFPLYFYTCTCIFINVQVRVSDLMVISFVPFWSFEDKLLLSIS